MSAQHRTKCAYYGRLQSGGRIVRDVCPHRSGSFYFTIDIDPGRSGGTTRLREAAIISPQNAVTNASAADDGPGYDLYIATDCIPVPEAPGIRQAHSSGTRHLPGEVSGVLFILRSQACTLSLCMLTPMSHTGWDLAERGLVNAQADRSRHLLLSAFLCRCAPKTLRVCRQLVLS